MKKRCKEKNKKGRKNVITATKKTVKTEVSHVAPAPTNNGLGAETKCLQNIQRDLNFLKSQNMQLLEITDLISKLLYVFVKPLRLLNVLGAFVCHPKIMSKNLFYYLYIKKNGDFSNSFYLRRYPDVRALRYDPLWHYCCHGWSEKRNPSPTFSTADYLFDNPDVANAGLNPFYHYLRYGKNEPQRYVRSTPGRRAAAVPVPPLSLIRLPYSTSDVILTDEAVKDIHDCIMRGLENEA